MSVPRVRRGTEGDAEAIAVVEALSFASPAERFSMRQIRALLGNPNADVLVLERAGVGKSGVGAVAVVGWCCALVRRSAGGRVAGRIYSVAVSPEGRGTGGGRAMLMRALELLRERGATRVYLEVRADNAPAIGLYVTAGFTHHEHLRGYYGPGVDGVRMVLKAGSGS